MIPREFLKELKQRKEEIDESLQLSPFRECFTIKDLRLIKFIWNDIMKERLTMIQLENIIDEPVEAEDFVGKTIEKFEQYITTTKDDSNYEW